MTRENSPEFSNVLESPCLGVETVAEQSGLLMRESCAWYVTFRTASFEIREESFQLQGMSLSDLFYDYVNWGHSLIFTNPLIVVFCQNSSFHIHFVFLYRVIDLSHFLMSDKMYM